MKKLVVFLLLCLFNMPIFCFAKEETPFFDITNLTENFLKTESNKISLDYAENKTQLFNDAVMKYSQGNVTASLDDYSKIIDITKTDFGLLNLAKTFYKIGFFSLAEKTLDKIEKKEEMASLLNDLKKAGHVKQLSLDDEIFLGKALTSILYDNLASETILDLNKHGNILEKSDWANYVAANGYIQMKQYKQALLSINKAISKNPDNNLYILLKLRILTLQENYKAALKYVEKVEKSNLIKLSFLNDFTIQKKDILSNLSKIQEDKLLHKAEIEILKDDIYSAKNILDEIVGKDKLNYKALALLGFCNLKTNDIVSAENNFKKVNELKPNSAAALEGTGDIEFINYRYKNALKQYEKAYKKDKNNTALINKIILTSVFAQEPEKTVKMAKIYSNKGNSQFYDFYNVGTTIAKYIQKDRINLSDEYVKKAITLNPFWNISWLEFGKNELNNGHDILVQNILEAVYLSREINYQYYYLNVLYNLKEQNDQEALNNLDKTLEMNPNFVPAQELKAMIKSSL